MQNATIILFYTRLLSASVVFKDSWKLNSLILQCKAYSYFILKVITLTQIINFTLIQNSQQYHKIQFQFTSLSIQYSSRQNFSQSHLQFYN